MKFLDGLKKIGEDIKGKISSKYKIKNLDVNEEAVANCKEEVLSGKQIEIQNYKKAKCPNEEPRRAYNIDNVMMATTDIGKIKEKQEDSVAILYHPNNPKYKMMLVADGVGGAKNGEYASQEIAKNMINWFESLDVKYLEQDMIEDIEELEHDKIIEIEKFIRKNYPGAASTYVSAIVADKRTLVSSIGDSRAYILNNNNKLEQVTIDDNKQFQKWYRKWQYIEKKRQLDEEEVNRKAEEKDNLRFRKDSNIITNCIAGENEMPTIKHKYIENDTYKTLMLFSDGVTDCLSDERIKVITRIVPPRHLANMLVNQAINEDSHKNIPSENDKNMQDDNYKEKITAGKDNTTAVVYDNTKGEERENDKEDENCR